MLPNWLNALGTPFRGDSAATLHAADPQQERLAARDATIVAPLLHLAPIRFAGEDATAFLQGQLSSDVKQVNPAHAQLSSYSTPKGRMLASFVLFHDSEGLVMLPSADIRDAIHKRLSMFIMRSKVKASVPELALFGLAGPAAEALIGSLFGRVPEADFSTVQHASGSVVRLPQLGYVIAVASEQAAAVWQALTAGATPVGPAAWQWREVAAGIVRIETATQELFVPQMANFDLVGAISFTKGCYPGQEIVARMQYLGKLKKRAYLAHIATDEPVVPGQSLFSADFGEQATGQVANAAAAPNGGNDAIVIIHSSSVDVGVHLGSPTGPALAFRALPYTV